MAVKLLSPRAAVYQSYCCTFRPHFVVESSPVVSAPVQAAPRSSHHAGGLRVKSQALGDAARILHPTAAALQNYWILVTAQIVTDFNCRNSPQILTQLWSNLVPEELQQPEPNQDYF